MSGNRIWCENQLDGIFKQTDETGAFIDKRCAGTINTSEFVDEDGTPYTGGDFFLKFFEHKMKRKLLGYEDIDDQIADRTYFVGLLENTVQLVLTPYSVTGHLYLRIRIVDSRYRVEYHWITIVLGCNILDLENMIFVVVVTDPYFNPFVGCARPIFIVGERIIDHLAK